jgi:manganese/zinc/iron transport system permease protein
MVKEFLKSFVFQGIESLQDASFVVVALGSLVFGALTGLSGTFILVHRLSLIGDVLAHAAVPGIILLWLLTQPVGDWLLTFGAISSISLAWTLIAYFKRYKFIHSDASSSCTLVLFFGLGLVLHSKASRLQGFGQIGVEKLFLGSIATVLQSEIQLGLGLLFCFIFFLIMFWSKIWPMLFDYSWNSNHKVMPFSFNIYKAVLAFFMVVSIALAMRSLGILLLITLCITPAIIARHLTKTLSAMCFISALLGSVFCLIGGAWSAIPTGPPTGPAIVLVAAISLILLCIFNAVFQWQKTKVKGILFD